MSSTFSIGRLRPREGRVDLIHAAHDHRPLDGGEGVRGEEARRGVALHSVDHNAEFVLQRLAGIEDHAETSLEPVRVSLSATITSAGQEM